MKVRTAVVGVAVLAFIAGGFLGGLFPQFGVGTGGSGTGKPAKEQPAGKQPEQKLVAHDPTVLDDARIVQVKIDERHYQMADAAGGPHGYRDATLEEIVAAARAAQGNNRGIRVRVARTPRSRSSAEHALRDKLEAAGIGKDAIEWLDGPEP